MKIRLQKFLADLGLASRRKAEEFIKAGLVKVNGVVVTEMGTKIDPAVDDIAVEDAVKQHKKKALLLAFNKPRGIVTNLPQKGEKDIKSILPQKLKGCTPIGRLDKDSEGLILLTDNGALAREILHSIPPHERDYLVWTNAPISEAGFEQLRKGVQILGEQTLPCEIRAYTPKYFKMTLVEGRNRQIRRMVQSVGSQVVKLIRIRFGYISLGELKPGEFQKVEWVEPRPRSAPRRPRPQR